MPAQIVAHLGCDCQATVPTRRGTAPVIGKALPRIPRVKDDSPPLIRGRESERLLANAFADAQQRGKVAYDGVIKAFYRDRRVAKIIHDRARATRCLDDKEEIQQQIASRSYKVDFTRPGLALAYGAINGSSIRTADGRQYVKSDSGAWTDGDRTVTRFQEPEGTFAVAEIAPTRY